jgi:hypothetical protein
MKVYGVFKSEMIMPIMHETLIDLYSDINTAKAKCANLNAINNLPFEEDSYGPINGCEYFVAELEVK